MCAVDFAMKLIALHVGDDFVVETALGNQSVEDVIGKAVACTVLLSLVDPTYSLKMVLKRLVTIYNFENCSLRNLYGRLKVVFQTTLWVC